MIRAVAILNHPLCCGGLQEVVGLSGALLGGCAPGKFSEIAFINCVVDSAIITVSTVDWVRRHVSVHLSNVLHCEKQDILM